MNHSLSQARDLLLIQSVEQSDPNGNVLAAYDIRQAQLEAGNPEKPKKTDTGEYQIDDEHHEFLRKRAAKLREKLTSEHSALAGALGGSHWKKWAPLAILAGAFVIGILTNGLGRDRTINILSFPVIGMVLWNLFVYALIIFGWVFSRGKGEATNTGREYAFNPAHAHRGGPFVKLVTWVSGVGARGTEGADAGKVSQRATIIATASRTFIGAWMKATARLNLSRATVVLHLGAAMLALGAIAGMYGKALTFEYKAVWESTYLDKNSLHNVLNVFLSPASFVSGIPLPSPDELEAFRHPHGDNAGKWLHLYAATAAIFIIAPRLILAAIEAMKSKALAADIQLPESTSAYFQDVLRGVYGEVQTVRIYSYSFEPDGRTRDRCKEVAHDLWGSRLDIDIIDSVPYGGEDDVIDALSKSEDGLADHVMVLMNLSASPEQEAHGHFVKQLKELASASSRKNSLLVILDPTTFRKKFHDLPEFDRRFDERRKSWERVLREHDVAPVMLGDSSDDLRGIAEACLAI